MSIFRWIDDRCPPFAPAGIVIGPWDRGYLRVRDTGRFMIGRPAKLLLQRVQEGREVFWNLRIGEPERPIRRRISQQNRCARHEAAHGLAEKTTGATCTPQMCSSYY